MDQFNLQRFVDAQEPVYDLILSELAAGQKRSHWMWFVFPQVQGLGQSPTARKYAIRGRHEATAFLNHECLGSRLRQCTNLVNEIDGLSIQQVFGYPDYMKFRSCMTLFDEVVEGTDVFCTSLKKYFDRNPDPVTLEILAMESPV